MKILKMICLTIVQLVKQIWHLPKTLADVVKDKQAQLVRKEQNAERLDRIRNPSKYLGK